MRINLLVLAVLVLILGAGFAGAASFSGSAGSFAGSLSQRQPGSFQSFYGADSRDTYWPQLNDRESCQARQDLILQVSPGNCQPLPLFRPYLGSSCPLGFLGLLFHVYHPYSGCERKNAHTPELPYNYPASSIKTSPSGCERKNAHTPEFPQYIVVPEASDNNMYSFINPCFCPS